MMSPKGSAGFRAVFVLAAVAVLAGVTSQAKSFSAGTHWSSFTISIVFCVIARAHPYTPPSHGPPEFLADDVTRVVFVNIMRRRSDIC